MGSSIVVVGSLNMDQVVHAPRHPHIGETILGSEYRTFFGGKGANQAVAASRCGASVTMVGRVGTDAFGDAIFENLKHEGVELTYLRRDAQAATGVAVIVVDDKGDNTIVVAPGANANVTAQDVQSALPAFSHASVLVLQLEIPLPAVETAIHAGSELRMQVILNPAPAQSLSPELVQQVDYLILNQNELRILSSNDELQPAIRRLKSMGASKILLTLGEDGVMLDDDKTQVHLPAYPVKAIATVGAGDAFVGAFAAAIAQGATSLEAARWGNAAGALAVTRPGAQSSLPYGEEIDLLQSINC
jgi:ribokinase